MKTYKGLYERIVTFENLHEAFRKAAKGKGLRADCAEFAYGREREILLLQEELQSGTYRHGPYREFTVSDPKKEGEKNEVPRGGLVVPKSGRTAEPGNLR